MTSATDHVREALETFASKVTARTSTAVGQPEAQLVGPLAELIEQAGAALGQEVTASPEASAAEVGRPDVAVLVSQLLSGYVEAKAPGLGADTSRFKGRDREQWSRFRLLPNIVYSDGSDWCLYQNGEKVQEARFAGNVSTDGAAAIGPDDSLAFQGLVSTFLAWDPIVPSAAPELAEALAPLCKYLAEDVARAADAKSDGAMGLLLTEWRDLLFSEADVPQFADAYAQTVTFALLLARVEGAELDDLDDAVHALRGAHGLIGEVLRTLATSPAVHTEVGTGIDVLRRSIRAVEPAQLTKKLAGTDPWIYFYEDFLAAYDAGLRESRGAFYTPHQVVGCQVRLVDELLVNSLGRQLGYADDDVIVLDPAAGTGTYPLKVIDTALERVASIQGPGAVPARATRLAEQVCAFELLVGPYAVCQLRVTQALTEQGAALPSAGPTVVLTDTLESPYAAPPGQITLLQAPLAAEHKRAVEVKEQAQVLVCMGNPPYDDQRDPASARKGGWVRFGDPGASDLPIFDDFLRPARDAGLGVNLRYAYNDYLYFWRWAIWKVCEHHGGGPGIVSYITASSYLQGKPYVGVREHMRREFDHIWIIDLEGDSIGPHKTENVFDIRTPVAIAIAFREGPADRERPAEVKFARITGRRQEKFDALDSVASFSDLSWEECPPGWDAPFRPVASGDLGTWPKLGDLFPWQHPGVAIHRTWPVAHDRDSLTKRWTTLLEAPTDVKKGLFGETRDRKIDHSYGRVDWKRGDAKLPALSVVDGDAQPEGIERYAWRSFDRQFLLADGRLIDTPRPPLWQTQFDGQIYLTTLLTTRLGDGPAVTASAHPPDFNHFNGRACQVLCLYRDAEAAEPNLAPGLLSQLGADLGMHVSVEDFAAYCYAVMAHPGYVQQFGHELGTDAPRVPISLDAGLFSEAVEWGKTLIWTHTFGERLADAEKGRPASQVPPGTARNTVQVPNDEEACPSTFGYDAESQQLRVGAGVFEPVPPAVREYEVSGLRVLDSWLGYRLREGPRTKRSQLDHVRPHVWTEQDTTELLQLLWTLERTVDSEPFLEELLARITSGPLLAASDLDPPSEEARKAPAAQPDPERLPGFDD